MGVLAASRVMPCRGFWLIRAAFYQVLSQVLPEYLGVRGEQVQELSVREDRVIRRRDPLLVPDLLEQLAVLDRDNVDVLSAAIVRVQLRVAC